MSKLFRAFLMLLAVSMLLTSIPCLADTEPSSILGGTPIEEYVDTEDRYVNLLLLGIDYQRDRYNGSGNKAKGIDNGYYVCHADAFMIVSINMTTDQVNLLSIPRDTVTYVPGVRGLYKLDAAVNCGKTWEEGLENARAAASWLLGGVKVDYYACLDMGAMIELGDVIGGIDVFVEMNYRSGRRTYKKGMQHLDGQGATDYGQARTNATVNPNDLGRTARQRQVVTAIIEKMRDNPELIKKAWNRATDGTLNFFTDMKLGTLINLAAKAAKTDAIGSYVLTGPYIHVMDWNFTLTDQKNRIEVLKEVFGIDAEELPFVDRAYLEWLEKNGLNFVHSINQAADILACGREQANLSAEDTALLDELEECILKLKTVFTEAGINRSGVSKNTELYKTWSELQALGEKAAAAFGYAKKPRWTYTMRWNDDPFLNEYQPNWS